MDAAASIGRCFSVPGQGFLEAILPRNALLTSSNVSGEHLMSEY